MIVKSRPKFSFHVIWHHPKLADFYNVTSGVWDMVKWSFSNKRSYFVHDVILVKHKL